MFGYLEVLQRMQFCIASIQDTSMSTLRLGDTAPDLTQDSTAGPIRFPTWAGDPASTGRNTRAVRPCLRLTPQPNR